MNRQQALEWLVENVVRWPVSLAGLGQMSPWFWIAEYGDLILWNSGPHKSITQQDWLDATDNMKGKCDE